jgi:hypothetical protein
MRYPPSRKCDTPPRENAIPPHNIERARELDFDLDTKERKKNIYPLGASERSPNAIGSERLEAIRKACSLAETLLPLRDDIVKIVRENFLRLDPLWYRVAVMRLSEQSREKQTSAYFKGMLKNMLTAGGPTAKDFADEELLWLVSLPANEQAEVRERKAAATVATQASAIEAAKKRSREYAESLKGGIK